MVSHSSGMNQGNNDEEPLLTTITVAEFAALMQVPVGTVYRWNSDKTGPRYISAGKHVRYEVTDIKAWIESKKSVA